MSNPQKLKTVPVSALWLRKIGRKVHILAEIDGEWRLVWEEWEDGPFSAICEASGLRDKPLDPVTNNVIVTKS